MNSTKTILISGVATAALLGLAAPAQGGRGHAQMAGSRPTTVSAVRSSAPTQSAHARPTGNGTRFHGGGSNHGAQWNHRGGRGGGHHGNWRHHHHRFYPRYYYSGFYPYGFGYPYGYGFGYPYYGASADLYYNGTRRGYEYDRGRSGNVVVEVQNRLARAGYYRGSVDGVIGNETRRAIRAFERASRLPVDGRIDDQLLGRLGVG